MQEINSCLECTSDSPDLPIALVNHLLKTKKEYKNLKKQEIQDNDCFRNDMAYGDFRNLPRITASDKVLVIKYLILLKIQNMTDINADLIQWFINFSIKRLLVVMMKLKLCQTTVLRAFLCGN